jgi:Bacterial SH3 domain
MRSAAESGRSARIRRARTAVSTLVVLATLAVAAAPAQAASSAKVCGSRVAVVVESPGGFAVGYLYRGDRVRVLRRSADRRWARINTQNELRGWIRSRSLCR